MTISSLKQYFLPLAWLIALSGFVGSLIAQYSGFPPCSLCWWQRVCLYPQVILLGIALWRRDATIWIYGVALSVIGAGFALYQDLLYRGIIQEGSAICAPDVVSCTQKIPDILGVNMIEGSFLAFIAIAVLLYLSRPRSDR
jgi:disulfide bond formation protein DsbB